MPFYITSFTFNYDYDRTKLEYAETLSGVITTGVDYATAGSVSWYSNQPIADVTDYLFTLVFKIKAEVTGLAEIEGTFAEASDSAFNLTTDITLGGVSVDVTGFAPGAEAEIVIVPEVVGREVKVPVVLNVLPTDLSDLASIVVEYSYNEEDLKLVGVEVGIVNAVINEDGNGPTDTPGSGDQSNDQHDLDHPFGILQRFHPHFHLFSNAKAAEFPHGKKRFQAHQKCPDHAQIQDDGGDHGSDKDNKRNC